MSSITLVTYEGAPGGAADDAALARALDAKGVSVRFAVWNDPDVDWSKTGKAVVRSTWDYHLHAMAWSKWLAVAERQTRLVNDPGLLRWNSRKSYLRQLEAAGLPVISSLWVDHDVVPLRELPWPELVLKPQVGASAHEVKRFPREDPRAAAHLRRLVDAGGGVVQPYLEGVEQGERSLVFFNGAYSHAFTRPPFSSGTDPSVAPHAASDTEIDTGRHVVANLPSLPAYARVDLVPSEAGPRIMEVELIEPFLGLATAEGAAERFAAILL